MTFSLRSAPLAGFAALAAIALVITGCTAEPPTPVPTASDASALPPEILAIMDDPNYEGGRWGLSLIDLETGKTVLAMNPDEKFRMGSTAKILSVTAALDKLGADHRIDTPVIATGPISGGTLTGDLVLRGMGDLTLGAGVKADGTIDVQTFDHYDANVLPGLATLPAEDPLSGLDSLAAQVKAAGVNRVAGDVLVDDRLWDPVVLDKIPITPIVVNDNLIDFVVTPGAAAGDPATVTWRPQTAAYQPAFAVTTGATGSPIDLDVTPGDGGALALAGSVPAGAAPVVHTYQVPDPATWARTLFMEALVRAGVEVTSDPLTANPVASLPAAAELDASAPIAVYTSPPFAETARLINKVSHNLGANQLPLLLAAQEGKRTLDDGLAIEMSVLENGGLTTDEVTVTDGQGLPDNVITPAGLTDYLKYLTTTATFDTFYDSTPILGVDGSLASVLPAGDPAIGKAHAKTGTLVGADDATGGFVLETKALAGYLDAKSGKKYGFAIYVNDVPLGKDPTAVQGKVIQANADIGKITSLLYGLY
ncbi:D-alanyl-D-alanine carboxypeptidase/D-alanyl-D-alanine endopeptidase [Microbacterium rhizomatis]|uniref:D-alanyl-D-alanine carboxypeptidase/D-alanyl-D-alanine-endopeptidase n=1 Tax=Microbacterium rhizomatis TaxID=1631477 RepID=A0A5J5J411_9MICO|nr:D-alanyl-D-alanine carboxypeptidase/D-alanyl-D-alanine-endopeptidase [Microbacterium rhizomatis]KAA9110816.1 D-alanyl-D-alanine carboxypeptidase/D-alanyl-D-alanine-endopeptidase [Microbacterium rhizomatis]